VKGWRSTLRRDEDEEVATNIAPRWGTALLRPHREEEERCH
jgi:hypothetical protein